MVFFDRNDLISQISYRKQLNKLEADKDYYLESIEESKRSLHQLMSDPDNIEKFARERYLMKRDDEDIFLIIHDEDGGK